MANSIIEIFLYMSMVVIYVIADKGYRLSAVLVKPSLRSARR